MSAPRSHLVQVACRGSILGIFMVAACSGQVNRSGGDTTGGGNTTGTTSGTGGSGNPDQTGNSGSAGTTTVVSGAGGTSVIMPGGTAGSAMIVDTGTAPPSACSTSLPGSYTTMCSACHNQAGTANTRYPDLYTFMGTAAAFLTQVRTGGMAAAGQPQMAAYPAALISDADVMEIYSYFSSSAGKRPSINSVDLAGVVPLFATTDAVNGPIVFTRDDGAVITRGAGRVRGRHEKEGSFGQFLENYMDNRTYGFVNEDFTNTATKHIKTTYEPVSTPDHDGNRITNWRHWKEQGDNATFMLNDYMKDMTMSDIPMGVPPTGPVAFVQQFDDLNPPNGRSFTQGLNFEFEFGIFILPTALVTPGSRDSYYTDTFRLQIGIGGLTPYNMDFDNGMAPFNAMGPIPASRFGGSTTASWLRIEPYNYYGEMALNIQQENVQNFVQGRRLFHTDFTNGQHSDPGNPVLTRVAGFAGPMNQTNSCESCHFLNSPGFTLSGTLGPTSSMVFKFPGPGQIHQQTGSAASGTPTTSTVMLDGAPVTLTKPTFTVTTQAAGTPAFSARIARKLVGMGLLEAIDERSLLLRADPLDCNKDGISGRPNYIKDPVTNALRVGRFGWKAEKVSVQHQVAEAAADDLDVGTSMFKDSTGKVELTDQDLAQMTTYMRLLSVPPQLNPLETDPDVLAGEQIFKTVGCANCHQTDMVTGANHPFTELRNQAIKPYSDLLLHDMGPDLADNSGVAASDDPMAPAAASEWRTPPLWGMSKLIIVDPMHRTGNLGLLHDGRAKSVTEAVLWHGGEASVVKTAFIALPTAQRNQLLAFVNSL
jgi:CxxC motif-containing protein (DUF1111 family)/cytochrome c553